MNNPREPVAGPQRVRIKDVARAAGVSTATVSNVYNKKGEVAPATRQMVLATGKRLGYQPNPSGRALRTGHTRVLGILVSYRDSPVWQDTYLPYYRGIISDAAIEAMDHGYSVVAASPTAERLGETLPPLDGVIVVDPLENDAIVAYCSERGIPLVADGGFVGGHPGPRQMAVFGEVHRYVRAILDLTAERHRARTGSAPITMGLFTGSFRDRYSADTEAAFSSWCAANNARAVITALKPGEEAGHVARRILTEDGLDGIYCLNESYSGAITAAAAALGITIPHDLVVSSAATSEQAVRDPRVNYVEHASADKPGRLAVRLLVDFLERGERQDATVTFRLRPAEPVTESL